LNYTGLVHAIPKKWKQIIKNHTFQQNKKTENIVDKLKSYNKVPKEIYKVLISKISEIPSTPFNKWNKYFKDHITLETFLRSFELVNQITISSETRFFHFKMLHRILTTKENLFNWNIIDSDLCSFCEEEIETLCHIFVECEVTKIFWTHLQKWIARRFHTNIELSPSEIIFGTQNNSLLFVDNLYMLGKQLIYKYKNTNTFPTLNNYTIYIKSVQNLEKGIDMNRNLLTLYQNKWQGVEL
jgi:hypothetical protein